MSNLKSNWCNSPDHVWRPDRRDFLQVGLMGGLGLALGDLLRLEAAAAETPAGKEGTAKSVIHIFLPGGMAAQETFDPKEIGRASCRERV